MNHVVTRHIVAIVCLLSLLGGSAPAATITLVPLDSPGVGFNDLTPASPVGLNAGTTVGEQRLIAVQHALDIWAAALDSPVEILVEARFTNLFCNDTSAALASAGPESVHRDFFGAPLPLTWYPQALANKFAGFDLAPGDRDIAISFNSSIGGSCLFPASWYYGLDANPGGGNVDLVTVALHELAHGLGFISLVTVENGQRLQDFDDVYSLSLENHSACRLYPPMSDKERMKASVDTGDLHWTGLNVNIAGGPLNAGRHPEGHVEIHAPSPASSGSSVSHFSTALDPDQLMEPSYKGPNHDIALTVALMHDLGWGGEFPTSANPACNDGNFRVNTHGVGDQNLPDVAVAADGSFLATWTSNGINNTFLEDVEGQDGDGYGVYAQRYSSTGQPVGDEFRVNTDTDGHQFLPAVAAGSGGTFVVVWEGPDGDGPGVWAQRYDSQGSPLGSNFLVNTYTTSHQGNHPKVDANAAGDIVVVWASLDQIGDGYEVFGQRFDSAGTPQGVEFQVNTYTSGNQGRRFDLTLADDGSFVVVWHSESQDSPQIGYGYDGGVYGQRFSSTGDPVGSEFRVNTHTVNDQGVFGLAADTDSAGNFVVTWTSVQDDGHTTVSIPYGGIFGQRFLSDGSAIGDEFQINVEARHIQFDNDVAMAPSGEFLVTWQTFVKSGKGSGQFPILNRPSNDYDVLARVFDSSGNGGEEFRINAFLPGDQRESAAAVGASSNFIVLFSSEYCDGSDENLCRAGPDGMSGGVFGQRLSLQLPSCDPTPRSNCSTPTKSSIVLKQAPGKKLIWKWLKGTPLNSGDFGQPTAGLTNYVLCVYEGDSTPSLAMTAALPAGGLCGGKPCWKNLGTKGKGYAYKDRDAASDGVAKVLLRTGEEGRSKIVITGAGQDLPLPTLPLANYEGLIVQLINGNERCWESRYSAPAKKNEGGRFLDSW